MCAPTTQRYTLHTFGDSHSDFGWNQVPGVCTHHLGPVLCYSFSKEPHIRCKLDHVKDGDVVIFAFGEIDCRCHIKKQVERQGIDAEVIIEKLVSSYISAIQEIMRPYPKCTIFVQSITPAVRKMSTTENEMYPFIGSDEERASYVKIFNEICRREICKLPSATIHFLDVWERYADRGGFLRADMSDGHVHIQNPVFLRIPLINAGFLEA